MVRSLQGSRHAHHRQKPCTIDKSDGVHELLQGCRINMFGRHICRIHCSFDLDQLQALTPEFFLYPQVSIWSPRVACHPDRSA